MYIVHRPTSIIRAIGWTTTSVVLQHSIADQLARWQKLSLYLSLAGELIGPKVTWQPWLQRWQSSYLFYSVQRCSMAPYIYSIVNIFIASTLYNNVCDRRKTCDCMFMCIIHTLYVLAYTLSTDELTDNLKIIVFCEKFKLILLCGIKNITSIYLCYSNDQI